MIVWYKEDMTSMNTIVLTGVSGCGKSSVGKALAKRLGRVFYNGDDFHPQVNIEKMADGNPLDDEDRLPWLKRLHELITCRGEQGELIVLACSALKKSYRDVLLQGNSLVIFVHLEGSFELILERMQAREGHYMKAEMLQSQFDILERPQNGVRIDIAQTVEQIVDEIIGSLNL